MFSHQIYFKRIIIIILHEKGLYLRISYVIYTTINYLLLSPPILFWDEYAYLDNVKNVLLNTPYFEYYRFPLLCGY